MTVSYLYVRNLDRASTIATPFTQRCVSVEVHNEFVAGRKPEAFTKKENEAMRFVLKQLVERNKWSQEKVGDFLGIGQQAAGRILGGGGFSRPSALRLATQSGFDSAESMLADLGALADPAKTPEGLAWKERDIAAGLARRAQCDERAIERVNARYTESQHRAKPLKWWLNKYIAEDRELEDERRTIPEAPASSPPQPMRVRKGRKTA